MPELPEVETVRRQLEKELKGATIQDVVIQFAGKLSPTPTKFIELIKGKEVITKYHKFALKAHYMRAKNQLNLMEFRNAEKILEEEAKPILKKLIEKYHIYTEG